MIDGPTSFSTDAMNVIDRVLSSIGTKTDLLNESWTPLERVVHAFHMRDLWAKLKPVFDSITVDDDACDCLSHISTSGIKNGLENMAEQMVHPYSGRYEYIKDLKSTPYANGDHFTLADRQVPPLTDAETWKRWKEDLKFYYGEASLRDVAYFLRCHYRRGH